MCLLSACKIILQEHIAEGKYATEDKDLRSESIAEPKPNANPESDFKIHGQLMKIKHKAWICHTRKWSCMLEIITVNRGRDCQKNNLQQWWKLQEN